MHIRIRQFSEAPIHRRIWSVLSSGSMFICNGMIHFLPLDKWVLFGFNAHISQKWSIIWKNTPKWQRHEKNQHSYVINNLRNTKITCTKKTQQLRRLKNEYIYRDKQNFRFFLKIFKQKFIKLNNDKNLIWTLMSTMQKYCFLQNNNTLWFIDTHLNWWNFYIKIPLNGTNWAQINIIYAKLSAAF